MLNTGHTFNLSVGVGKLCVQIDCMHPLYYGKLRINVTDAIVI